MPFSLPSNPCGTIDSLAAPVALFVQPLRRDGLAYLARFGLDEGDESRHSGEDGAGQKRHDEKKTNEARH